MTDHRGQAEAFLESASETLSLVASDRLSTDGALVEALIGIGHALLAGPPKPPPIQLGHPYRSGESFTVPDPRYDQAADYVHPDQDPGVCADYVDPENSACT